MVHTMSAHNLLRQAETLKVSVADTSQGSAEAWMCRQSLQDLYQRMLITDLEYALDKKVEQDLWNHAFKNQITMFQSQTKDRNNPKRSEMQATLNLFLDTASGFYLQLYQELCSAFRLDLPMRKKALRYGILSEFNTGSYKMKLPKRSSCLYICQYCLVHLGDIARYRQQVEQAQTYYRHAVNVVPYNGQPYNQLAILEAARANKLATVFYYVRSIAVKHPFPVASLNLEKFYNKISNNQNEYKTKLSVSEMMSGFLQFHALLHHCTDISGAQVLSEKLATNLGTHIMSISFSSYQLLQMITINLFGLYHAKRRLDTASSASANQKEGEVELSLDEQRSYDVILEFTLHMFDVMLQCTPKQEVKAKEYHTLPVLKILMDWLMSEPDLLTHQATKKYPTIWPNLAKTLNTLQFVQQGKNSQAPNLSQYYKLPLPEDNDLQCFLPLGKAHSELQFQKLTLEGLPDTMEVMLRCQRIVEYGIVLAEDFPSLNLLNVKKFKSGRLEFSASTPHVKVMPGDIDGSGERRTVRTNVAIQAIIQSQLTKSTSDTSQQAEKFKKVKLEEKNKTADASVTASEISMSDTTDSSTSETLLQLQSSTGKSLEIATTLAGIIHDSSTKPTTANQPKKKVGFQLDEEQELKATQLSPQPAIMPTSQRIKQLWEPNPSTKSQNTKSTSSHSYSGSRKRDPWVKPPRMQKLQEQQRLQQQQQQQESFEEDPKGNNLDPRLIQQAVSNLTFSETAFGPMQFGMPHPQMPQQGGLTHQLSGEKQGSFDEDFGTASLFGSSPQTRGMPTDLRNDVTRYPIGLPGWPGASSAVNIGKDNPLGPQQPMPGSSNPESKENQRQQLLEAQRKLWQEGETNSPSKNPFTSLWDARNPDAPGDKNWQNKPRPDFNQKSFDQNAALRQLAQLQQNQALGNIEAMYRMQMSQASIRPPIGQQLSEQSVNQAGKMQSMGPNPNRLPFPLFQEKDIGQHNWSGNQQRAQDAASQNIHPALQNLFESAQKSQMPGTMNRQRMSNPEALMGLFNQSQQNQVRPGANIPTNQRPPGISTNQVLRMAYQQASGLQSNQSGSNPTNQMQRMPPNENAGLRMNQVGSGVSMARNQPHQQILENQHVRQARPHFTGSMEKDNFGLQQELNRLAEENMRSNDNMVGSPYNRKTNTNSLLSPNQYSSSTSGIDIGFSFPFKDMPKPDSPGSDGSFFSTTPDNKNVYGTPSSGTYSLFSQSPWNTPLNKPDPSSHNSSPFNSSSASNRTSPDRLTADDRSPNKPALSLGYNMVAPPNESSAGWSVPTNQNPPATVMAQNQGLWAAGPSPLEKLLERQRQQKTDPH